MSQVIVNVAFGAWYGRGQARLIEICKGLGEKCLTWVGPPPGSPTHSEVPYAFKAYAIAEARRGGHTKVLWMDASAVPQGPLAPVWEILDREGVFIAYNPGWTCDEWTSDECFELCGTPKEEYGKLPHCYSQVFGFDFEHAKGKNLFEEFLALARDGRAFAGPHQYGDGSGVPRGHRHDQSVLSLLGHKYKVPFNGPEFLRPSWDGEPTLIATYPA